VAKLCPQSDALYPESHAQLWDSLGRVFDEDAFITRAVEWLGGAVRIPYVSSDAFYYAAFLLRLPWSEHSTESYDTMGPVGEDERWKVFRPFHDYLVHSFPLTYVIITPCDCNKEGVNTIFSLATRAFR
jgi:Gly-Xaa carboxypeptidase